MCHTTSPTWNLALPPALIDVVEAEEEAAYEAPKPVDCDAREIAVVFVRISKAASSCCSTEVFSAGVNSRLPLSSSHRRPEQAHQPLHSSSPQPDKKTSEEAREIR